jgi:AraC-like DNA-binding protein
MRFIPSADVRVSHPAGEVLDLPRGIGRYLFVHLTTRALIRCGEDELRTKRGACMIYEPGHPIRQTAYGAAMRGYFMVFDGDDVAPMLARLRLPVNAVFYPTRTRFIGPLMRQVHTEFRRREINWAEVVSLLFSRVLIQLARELNGPLPPQGQGEGAASIERQRTFLEVRATVHGDIARQWTLPDMTRLAHLSSSRFSELYGSLFGVSPVEDLIQARLSRAKWLLTNTAMPISRVGRESGFTEPSHFCRLFKKRTGCAPSRYYDTYIAK